MIHLICPDGFLDLTSPQQTSKEFSLSKVVGSSLVSVKGLSEMRVMAAPPPRLVDLGVEIYLIPCNSRASSTLFAWSGLVLSSQISLCRPSTISFSRISSTRLLNLGKI